LLLEVVPDDVGATRAFASPEAAAVSHG
jgi:hypothetical protein